MVSSANIRWKLSVAVTHQVLPPAVWGQWKQINKQRQNRFLRRLLVNSSYLIWKPEPEFSHVISNQVKHALQGGIK